MSALTPLHLLDQHAAAGMERYRHVRAPDMVDRMLAGLECSHCLKRYAEPHGYPVLCQSCWDAASPAARLSFSFLGIPQIAELRVRKGSND